MTKQEMEKETRVLLLNASENRTEIANNTGLGFEWLKKFANDYNDDYGVRKVQKLHNYLRGKGKTN